MKITFWGVRGSIPVPLAPNQVRSKIDAILRLVTPADVVTDESRCAFVKSLPNELYGTVGGNTPCVEVSLENGKRVVFDCGSGLHSLGQETTPPADKTFHIILSHFHWDHLQGLPFFDYAFKKDHTLHFYSPTRNYKKYLVNQMAAPYFPGSMAELFLANLRFHTINPEGTLKIGNAVVKTREMNHPGGSWAYSLTEKGKKCIYATDVELQEEDFVRTPERVAFFNRAAAIILDAQYSLGEAFNKENWGHSSFSHAIDFAAFWKIDRVYLFHHEPTYDDEKIYALFEAARRYSQSLYGSRIRVFTAGEGTTVDI
jgi:phosphoribosyl 1,2-cyclic phosphodiesterase